MTAAGRAGDHERVKLGIIGDAHLGCADYTDRRRADFSQAFRNAVELCLREGAEALCLLGDVFDSALTRRSVEAFAAIMREVGPVFERLRNEGRPVLAIAGNHEFGRGREAGELGVLESLGLLRVLRGDEVILDGCGVLGFPWQAEDEVHQLGNRVREAARRSRARRRILLLHNFVRGSAFIPTHLGEIDPEVADGFDRVFVGHHHDQEDLGAFTMPGATEVQNLAEADKSKAVVIYDTTTGRRVVHRLPKTRDVLLLAYDLGSFRDREEALAVLRARIVESDVSKSFVCVRLTGCAPGWSLSRPEVLGLLRGLDVVDKFVEVRASTAIRIASDAVRGTRIDGLLSSEFGEDAAKARRYVERCTDDAFASELIEAILR